MGAKSRSSPSPSSPTMLPNFQSRPVELTRVHRHRGISCLIKISRTMRSEIRRDDLFILAREEEEGGGRRARNRESRLEIGGGKGGGEKEEWTITPLHGAHEDVDGSRSRVKNINPGWRGPLVTGVVSVNHVPALSSSRRQRRCPCAR